MAELDPKVASLSPNLYVAAKRTNLNNAQINQVNQIANTVAINKELSSLPKNQAAERWKTLDPHIQEQVKAMYGEASYIPRMDGFVAPTSMGAVAHDVSKVASGALHVAISPFRGLFKAAEVYNRAINTPYLLYREISQGQNPLSWSTWKGAIDGRSVFDQEAVQPLVKEYGAVDSFVATKTLAGYKPGEIIDAYGKVDNLIVDSINRMFNEPEKFSQMLNRFKAAQVSPGRDIMRSLFNTPMTGASAVDKTAWSYSTGLIDMAYQVAIDPLTWITGGTTKLLTKGEKLAELYFKAPADAKEKVIENIFKDPKVVNTWNVFGPVVKELHDARKAGESTAAIMDRIKYFYPQFNDSNLLHLFVENKVFDVNSAENFAKQGDNMLSLINGRVDGTTFFRNGVPLAKAGRNRIAGFNMAIGNYFNGTATGLEKAGIKEIEEAGKLLDPVTDTIAAENLTKIRKELDRIPRSIGRLVARFPGNAEIGVMDNNVARTLGTVNALARVIYTKSFANMFSEHFLQANPQDRVILLRGLYIQIMDAMGLKGTEGGRKLMDDIIQDKFGESTTYASAARIQIPPQFEKNIESVKIPHSQPDAGNTGLLEMEHAGTLHNYNATKMIGNLPWSAKYGELSLADFALKRHDASKFRTAMDMIGGTTRSKAIRGLVNSWSVATLFPRLGIRSSIDEAFFYSMTAPAQDLFNFAVRNRGRKLNAAMIAMAGEKQLVPHLSRAFRDLFGKDPSKFVSLENRYIKLGKINGVEALKLNKRADIANHALKMIEHTIPEDMRESMRQAMEHNPDVISSMVNSIVGKSALEAGLNPADLSATIISDSQLTNMYRATGFIPTGKGQKYMMDELAKINDAAPAAAHFENFFMRFTKNGLKLPSGTYMDPGVTFIHFNGLRTEEDFAAAKKVLLRQIGIGENGEILNAVDLNHFLDMSMYSSRDKADGLTPVQSATHRIEAMLTDMYRVFHGDAIDFNDRLYTFIVDLAKQYKDRGVPFTKSDGTIGYRKVSGTQAIAEAMNSLPFESFADLTKTFRMKGEINSLTNFAGETTNEGMYAKLMEWENKGMDWMDTQNNFIFRQPVLWFTYTKYRERYKNDEIRFYNQQIANGTREDVAKALAEKRFTELALNNAALNVLKYVDNPQIRSNLAWTLRTSGRFYRATEDFYRRVWRLKDVTPQVLYRMRLAHLGLSSSGFLHKDQNGDPYLVMPADNIIFHAVNGSMSVFGANMKQPLFNDFTMKLALMNPSFQQEAGQPTLSGPFAAVPVFAMQNILNKWGGDLGKRVATELDNLALGNMNQNLNWTKVLVPASVKRVYDMIPKGEWDQQEASATMQAIAYNAAHGLFLSPDLLAQMPPEERAKAKSDYLKQIKLSAHSIVFMRAFLGLISPLPPTPQESKDVPNYVKDNGITSIRGEFADIVQSIKRNSGGLIHDPYEAALMTFMGKHPGKLVYTVSRNDKNVSVLLNNTKEMQNWILSNSDAINNYGDAALIFAPHIGKYSADVYTWMQGVGIASNRKVADYFDEVAVAQDRQKYFDLKQAAEQALDDPTLNTYQRQGVLAQLAQRQDAMKQANPLLDYALGSNQYGIGKQKTMLDTLTSILANNDVKMTEATRAKMQTAVYIVQNAIAQLEATPPYNAVNWTQFKYDIKAQTMAALLELGGGDARGSIQDPILSEANRAIFQPILDFLVRNTLKASF